GLDPRTTASMFADAKCVGEKQINGEDCFILKLCVDPQTLKGRSEGPAEIIRHVAHTAKGHGLDSRTTTSMFADAKCVGEKKINGEDYFILKLCAESQMLKARSEGPAEIMRHVLFGYFNFWVPPNNGSLWGNGNSVSGATQQLAETMIRKKVAEMEMIKAREATRIQAEHRRLEREQLTNIPETNVS
ncbi:hypothetical protein Tco_1308955, partial [Tanacetum coccineum]